MSSPSKKLYRHMYTVKGYAFIRTTLFLMTKTVFSKSRWETATNKKF